MSTSPAQTISKSALQGSTKTVKHLENLANLILSIVPTQTTETKPARQATEAKLSLQLYLKGIEYKADALNLQDVEIRHKAFPALWDTVQRCLVTFQRKMSQLPVLVKENLLPSLLEPLIHLFVNQNNVSPDPKFSTKFVSMLRIAADIAQDTQL